MHCLGEDLTRTKYEQGKILCYCACRSSGVTPSVPLVTSNSGAGFVQWLGIGTSCAGRVRISTEEGTLAVHP